MFEPQQKDLNVSQVAKDPLSEITVFNKYAKFLPAYGRRENWNEIIDRNAAMHRAKYPHMAEEIDAVYRDFVLPKKVLPSMRSLQFGGRPIQMNEARIFNCLARETKFVTSDGIKSFNDFNDGDTTRVLTDKGRWKDAVVRSYGVDDLQRISFSRGRHRVEVLATANHRWLLDDGTVTTNLKVGDKLKPLEPVFEAFSYEDASLDEQLHWCYGFVYGDGTVVNKGKPSQSSMVRLCGKKAEYLSRFTNVGFKHSFPPSCNQDPIVYTGKYAKGLPGPDMDPALIRAFVAGYLAADGSTSTQLTLQASSPEAQEFVRTMFPVAGVFVTSESVVSTTTNYGQSSAIRFCLSRRFSEGKRYLFTVQSIEPARRSDVWCLEVEDDASFVLASGAVTGNCAFFPAESTKFFSELMFLLLGGTGVGYSVQQRHVSKLPKIKAPESDREYKFQIQDSIIGWADAVKVLCKAFFSAGTLPVFDYRDIREKGSDLVTTGGKAPGPEPLRVCLERIEPILRGAIGRKLTSLEVHDMACAIADSVRAGGIRRAAMICLFDRWDEEMLTCKSGEWYLTHPARGRANNSAVLPRNEVTEEEFRELMRRVEASGCGEPGVYWTNNKDWGANPCVEIALRPYQMCNLTEINAGVITDQESYNAAARAAAFLGTLQAGYTDFHYLNPKWRIACEKDALLGVSMTGIASGAIDSLDEEEAAKNAVAENVRVSRLIGIRSAARVTTVKPAGTTSLVLGTSSGIHAWHAPYYIRRMRAGKDEALAQYMLKAAPALVEDDVTDSRQVVLSFPQKAPEGAVLRDEPMLNLLERVKRVSKKWVAAGHISGHNRHNVSCTISVKDDEWGALAAWMWENRDHYAGISVLPYFGSEAYPQMPFEDITREQYEAMLPHLNGIDIGQVFESNGDGVDLAAEAACAGGVCELVM